jgi:hypothetical protein
LAIRLGTGSIGKKVEDRVKELFAPAARPLVVDIEFVDAATKQARKFTVTISMDRSFRARRGNCVRQPMTNQRK